MDLTVVRKNLMDQDYHTPVKNIGFYYLEGSIKRIQLFKTNLGPKVNVNIEGGKKERGETLKTCQRHNSIYNWIPYEPLVVRIFWQRPCDLSCTSRLLCIWFTDDEPRIQVLFRSVPRALYMYRRILNFRATDTTVSVFIEDSVTGWGTVWDEEMNAYFFGVSPYPNNTTILVEPIVRRQRNLFEETPVVF